MRSKRKEQETGMDKLVGTRLTPARREEIGQMIAVKVVDVATLRDKRREDFKSLNAQIKSEQDTIDELARMLIRDQETVAQGELFIGQTRETKEQVQRALAGVACHAGETKDPLPSQPHTYRGGGETCKLCDSDRKDGVHVDEVPAVDEAAPLIRDHQFVEALREDVSDVPKCSSCGKTMREHAFIAGVDPEMAPEPIYGTATGTGE